MYKDLFTQLGLSTNESIIYEYLLKNGESSAGAIIKKTPLKRGVIYNCLEDLAKKDLITEQRIAKNKGGGKISYFTPNHPQKLEEYVESEKSRLEKVQKTLDLSLPSIISDFNLISGKPGVKFYEGIEGIKKVLDDTLNNNTKKEIRAFSDLAKYMKYLKTWNTKHYAPRRRELGIYEKAIVPDNPFALESIKEYFKNKESKKLTDNVFVDHKSYPFKTEINIYENKVSFVTFSEKNHIGVIIENKEIFDSMSSIFNIIWNSKKKQAPPHISE